MSNHTASGTPVNDKPQYVVEGEPRNAWGGRVLPRVYDADEVERLAYEHAGDRRLMAADLGVTAGTLSQHLARRLSLGEAFERGVARRSRREAALSARRADPDDSLVLSAIAGGNRTYADIRRATQLELSRVAMAVERLMASMAVFERTAYPLNKLYLAGEEVGR